MLNRMIPSFVISMSGGNRGGAYNAFTGGFFGPGGKFNLLDRIRMLLLFFAWTSFMYTIVRR